MTSQTSGGISYEITIYCATCQRMVYEECGTGGDNIGSLQITQVMICT